MGGFADGLNTALYALEGNWAEAGWALVALVPIVGDGIAAARKVKKRTDGASDASNKGPTICPTTAGGDSFVAGTEVLMADGSTKPIEDLQTGDEVVATNPETGETAVKTVTATILTETDKSYVDVTVSTEDGARTIVTTDHHPFWAESEKAWLDAGELKPGMALRTETGTTVSVIGTRSYEAHQNTYNLTVADLHTYYVLAQLRSSFTTATAGTVGRAGRGYLHVTKMLVVSAITQMDRAPGSGFAVVSRNAKR